MVGKTRKSRVLAVLCIVGMLAGCGNEAGEIDKITEENENGVPEASEAGAKGGFVESEVVLPQEVTKIYAMQRLADGRVEILAENQEKEKGYLFFSEDCGESFTSVETKEPFYGGWVTGGAIAPDGTAVLGGYFNDVEDGESFAMKSITPDGNLETVPLELPQVQRDASVSNVASQFAFDSAGNLIVQDLNGTILWIDRKTGACEETLSTEEDISYFSVVGEKLFAVTTTGIPIYDTTDRTELPRDTVLDEMMVKDASLSHSGTLDSFPMVFGESIDGEGIVYVNHEGIYFHNDGGSVSEQLVTGERSSLVDTSIQFVSVVMADETKILVQVADTGGGKILCYQYDENAAVLPEQEIEVYALEDSAVLRSGILLYQQKHPEIYVNLTIGMTGEDGVTAEDAVKALNTEILAGNVPDVLVLDGLPVDSYIEKGILADISEIVACVEKQDGLFENVADAYRTKDGCYRIPARFYVNLVVGDGECIQAGNSLAAFVEYAKKIKKEEPGANILQERPAKELLWTLYQADAANWFKDGVLDEERMKEWLILAESLYALDAYGDDATGAHTYNGLLVGTASTGATGILLKENKVGIGAAVSMIDIADILAIDKQTGVDYGLLASGETRSFVPYLQLGMSSNAGAAAEELLLTLLGKEAGSIDGESGGYPLNRAGWQEICAKSMEMYGPEGEISVGVSDAEGVAVGWQMNQLTEEACVVFTELLESVDTPVPTDTVIRSVVLEEAEHFVKGEKSLEETLAVIQQKVNLYLAE